MCLGISCSTIHSPRSPALLLVVASNSFDVIILGRDFFIVVFIASHYYASSAELRQAKLTFVSLIARNLSSLATI